MDAMPRPRPLHLHRETSRHGRTVWYVRLGKGPRIRIRAEHGTAAFDAEYLAAMSGAPRASKDGPEVGTLGWLVKFYRESAVWSNLGEDTRKQRERIFRPVLETAGVKPFLAIKTSTINAGLQRRAKTPSQARHFLDTMRGLFRWAFKNGHVKVDPTAGLDNPARKTGDGFLPWTEDMVAAYEHHWPIGTRQRVWLDVLLYTGLRVGDAFRLGRQHVRAGSIKTEKTGQMVGLDLLPVLVETLAAGPCGDLTYIIGGHGQSFTNKAAFGNAFTRAARAAGVPGSAHGVRKIAATRAANAGASEATLEALFGWSGGRMASLYTRTADRKRLATEGIHKLAGHKKRTSIPAPLGKVRGPAEKDQ